MYIMSAQHTKTHNKNKRKTHFFSLKRRLKSSLLFFMFITLFAMLSEWIGAQFFYQSHYDQFQVVDGDTLKKGAMRIRLLGIDAPELAQKCTSGVNQPLNASWPCGEDARIVLGAMIANKELRCDITKKDKYERGLGYCYVGQQDIGKAMISKGYAIATGVDYRIDEFEAKRQKRGIWSGAFMTPARWRKENM